MSVNTGGANQVTIERLEAQSKRQSEHVARLQDDKVKLDDLLVSSQSKVKQLQARVDAFHKWLIEDHLRHDTSYAYADEDPSDVFLAKFIIPPEDKPAEQDAKLGWPNLFPPEDKPCSLDHTQRGNFNLNTGGEYPLTCRECGEPMRYRED